MSSSPLNQSVPPRSSNFELLRIIAMLLIVAHHFAVHGYFQFATDSITLNELWEQFLASGGKIGVNIFVMISGYFLCQSKGFSLNKILRLWLSVLFYSLLFLGLFTVLGGVHVSPKQFISNFLPITSSRYWFISTYFTLYLLHPFINIFMQHLSRGQYKKLLMLLTFLWCLIPTFLTATFQSNPLWWFVYLYLLAGYIRTYHTTPQKPTKYWILAVLCYLLAYVSVPLLDLVGFRFPIASKHALFFFSMQRLPALLISVLLLLGFKNMRLHYNPFINLTAMTTLGIYLIHDNIFVRPFLWQTVFKNASYADSAWFIPYSIGVILIVFWGSALIELVRITCLEKIYKNPLSLLASYLESLANRFFTSKWFNYL